MVAAMQWISWVTTVAGVLVVPGLLGVLLDRWLGTGFVFTLLGFSLGMFVGISHAVRLMSRQNNRSPRR